MKIILKKLSKCFFVEELFISGCSDYIIIELNHCSLGAIRHQESSPLGDGIVVMVNVMMHFCPIIPSFHGFLVLYD
jgi:hypothetical protein